MQVSGWHQGHEKQWKARKQSATFCGTSLVELVPPVAWSMAEYRAALPSRKDWLQTVFPHFAICNNALTGLVTNW